MTFEEWCISRAIEYADLDAAGKKLATRWYIEDQRQAEELEAQVRARFWNGAKSAVTVFVVALAVCVASKKLQN